MHKHCKALFAITLVFKCSLITAKPSIYYENAEETSQSIGISTLEPPKDNAKPYRSSDAFDDLLAVDVEPEMYIYRDDLVSELTGADKILLDRKLEEAENMNWKHKYAYHRYTMQIFDEVKRFHAITSNVTDYNV